MQVTSYNPEPTCRPTIQDPIFDNTKSSIEKNIECGARHYFEESLKNQAQDGVELNDWIIEAVRKMNDDRTVQLSVVAVQRYTGHDVETDEHKRAYLHRMAEIIQNEIPGDFGYSDRWGWVAALRAGYAGVEAYYEDWKKR